MAVHYKYHQNYCTESHQYHLLYYCYVLFCRTCYPFSFKYRLRSRHLDFLTDSRLLFNDHINSIVAKSSQRSGAICRGFVSRNLTLMRKAFITYVRPTLEYNSCIWNPSHKHIIDTIENVQRRYIKRIPSLSRHLHCCGRFFF
jgi:hypothetical protein